MLLVALALAACVGISRGAGQGNDTYLVPLYSGGRKAPTVWSMAFSYGTPGVLYSGTVGEKMRGRGSCQVAEGGGTLLCSGGESSCPASSCMSALEIN